MPEHIGTIETAGTVTTKKGGTAFHVQLENPKWGYYIFNPGLQELCSNNVGKKVRITYTENEKGRNVDNIEVMPEVSTSTSEAMTKDDWGLKDRRITRTAIAKSIIEAQGKLAEGKSLKEYADKWFFWIYEIPFTEPPMVKKEAPKN